MDQTENFDESSSIEGAVERQLTTAPAIDGLLSAPTRSPVALALDEAMAAALDAQGDYRVLRRIPPPTPAGPESAGATALIVLDVETTGLSPGDEIIEISMARVRYDKRSGEMIGVEGTFNALREPGVPVPESVSLLTGLSSQDLAGHVIDPDAIADFVAGARLVIAHNASFDRPHVERAWPVFAKLPWACSCTEIDWRAHGFDGRALSHLVLQSGFFHEGHRAWDDVAALLHLLELATVSGTPLLLHLLESARTPAARVWALNAPFTARDRLKQRGYRWSAGETGAPRAWYRDVPVLEADNEVAYLRGDVLCEPVVVPVTVYDRFTDRAGLPRGDRP